MAKDPYRYFRVEGRELLEQMGRGVLELERGPSAELVGRLLRLAHTLKGAARVVKQRELADRAHAFEDTLGPHRAGTAAVPRADIDALLAHLDAMTGALHGLDEPPPAAPAEAEQRAVAAAAGQNPPPPKPAALARPEDPSRLARPASSELSDLLDGIGEIHSHIGALRKVSGTVEEVRALAVRLGDAGAPNRRGERPRGEAGHSVERGQALDDVTRAIERLGDALGAGLDQLERETDQVRELAERMRLVKAETMFTALQRTVRDGALALGRRAVFHGTGGDVRLDPAAAAGVQAALVQLVRNAVAHGIEPAEARVAARKTAEGRITVAVERRGADIVFTCADDGRGIDLEEVRRIALAKGLLAPGRAQEASAKDLLGLLVRGGISTSGAVTEIAGRGVGLDVARDAAAELAGSLAIQSTPGTGTTVILKIPALLAVIPSLLVDDAGAVTAIPLEAVRGALRIDATDVARHPEGESLLYEGRALPLVSLAATLGMVRGTERRGQRTSVLVVEGQGGQRAALTVDRLRGTAALLSRPLPARAAASPIVAGAWMDAAGIPQLILDPAALVQEAQRPVSRPAQPEVRRNPILIIDDSLTTRMLEQSILESAGYEVELAASAEEGLEKAARARYALFLVDVEMPGIDGFTFVERTRLDPALRDIPAILVSSRSAPEDLRRGLEAGAAAYVVKGDFDQGALLARIRTLVG